MLPDDGSGLPEAARRALAQADLVVDGVAPVARAADGLTLDALEPRDGRLDLAPLERLAPAVVRLDDALGAAQRSAGRIDTDGAVPIAEALSC